MSTDLPPPQANTISTELPPPLVLIPPGKREVVDETRAIEIIDHWKDQIKSYRSNNATAAPNAILCEKICLSDKSYTADAAGLIASFLTEAWDEGSPPLASGIKIADLSDIIASRLEDEGLQVLQVLCDAFKSSLLEEVDLSNNAMGCKGISVCSSVLSGQSSSLERLSLCNNGLSETTMKEVADILCGGDDGGDDEANDSESICERLTKIHFFNNMSGNGGCREFARILSKCTPNLVDVRFSGTRSGREGSLILSSALDGMDDRIRNLVRLDLADNSFGTEGGAALARAIRRCNNLKYLDMRDCCLEDDATGSICRAVWAADAPLEYLDLSGNDISRKGAKDIADLLEEIKGFLKVFRCEDNELTSRGITYIAPVLGGVIEEIQLSCNQCGSIGAQALITAYGNGEEMPLLRVIDLDRNAFPKTDVDQLMECFKGKLKNMEENDDDEDADDDLSTEEEDEEDDDINYERNQNVKTLTNNLAGLTVDHDLC